MRRLLVAGLLLARFFFGHAAYAQTSSTVSVDSLSDVHRVQAAVHSLMQQYDESRGLWATEGWWNAANTATVVGETAALDQDPQYVSVLNNTFKKAQLRFPQFRNEFYDDEGWWALAWIQAYDVTHRHEYLDMAESIFQDMSGGWDMTCGGGIWWKKDRRYKNAIANELFLSVAAHLAERESGKARNAYLAWAKREWKWFDGSGMINNHFLVNDGLTPACQNNGRTTWSYNQGVIVGGLLALSRISNDPKPKREAKRIASAAIENLSDSNQVLHDRTEPNCSKDTAQFKGIFMRNLVELEREEPDDEFKRFIRANADAVWSRARTQDEQFACRWSGPATPDGAAAATSALGALLAAARMH